MAFFEACLTALRSFVVVNDSSHTGDSFRCTQVYLRENPNIDDEMSGLLLPHERARLRSFDQDATCVRAVCLLLCASLCCCLCS